jgi:RNA polymerase sigma factor (sigma-70 family)
MNRPDYLSEEILEKHHDQAFKWAMSCCDYDRDRAWDVMQLMYIAILEKKAVYRFESGLRTWLFAVIKQIASQQYKKQYTFIKLKNRLAEFAQFREGHEILENIEISQRQKKVLKGMDNLSRQQRQIVELVYYRDFSLNETAEILGLTMGAVAKQFDRAKQKLSKTVD